ncbi:RING finger and CHY zinc finger domain-containing protein 1 isoform X3 [Pseudophryne corroboree]|uniref:RING finger and CHY zinc finger domain-containing protein 1 isoform X3 n=1 Tax=Pseudophryne corroboree TaxID=495146 RepID=UPI0030812757
MAAADSVSGDMEVPVGCEHYTRGCELRAPCCGKFYICRLCHDNKEAHKMDRFKVTQVQCMKCKLIQKAQQACEHCNHIFGDYFCNICHLYDKDKKQYHCDGCGICRIGPREQFEHCTKCNLCLPLSFRGNHKDIHTSRVGARVLPCGHLLHSTCYEDMLKQGYRCPLCMRSALDMSRYWRQLDEEVAQTPMPSEYQNMTVCILCNDCSARSTAPFHILGMKCESCNSYNTTQEGKPLSQPLT